MAKSFRRQKNKRIKKEKREKEVKTLFQSLRGMHDILPAEQPWWDKLVKATSDITNFYNFSRIETPLVERAEIFERGIGVDSDIVEKQMFALKTRSGERLVLRPENTAGVIRAYLEHGLSHLPQPLKIYYYGPFFRYEQPQAGRYRQFHQVGFEILGGEADPLYDVQTALVSLRLIEELKIKNPIIQINSLGCKNCRAIYRRKLQDYYRKLIYKTCKNCRRRLSLNPLRLLDCKNENCEQFKDRAPIMLDYLCSTCKAYFREVLEYLDELNLPYILNSHLVRGLDYYNGTVFELFSEGSNISLGGGGRYDHLGEILGGRKNILPAVGSSLGAERIIELMKAQGIEGLGKIKAKVFLVQIGKPAKKKIFGLIEAFRLAGIKVAESLSRESLGSQLKIADREKAEIALILGQREVFEESIIIRDMKSGAQEIVPLNKVVEEVRKRYTKN